MKVPTNITQKQAPDCQKGEHSDFSQVLKEITRNNNIDECLESADDLYGIKHYNIMALTVKKVGQIYESLCNRVYSKDLLAHQNCWVSQELKIFVWLIICHLQRKICQPEALDADFWARYAKIFHGKNVELMQYQLKLVICGRCQPRRWQKQEENLLNRLLQYNYILLRSNQIKDKLSSKWSEIAKNLYFLSGRLYFRNPKQIREHWLNHMDPKITKQPWSTLEDKNIIHAVLQHGKKWALAAKLGGNKRTQHMVKNRFHALLRLQQKNFPSVYDKEKLVKSMWEKYKLLCQDNPGAQHDSSELKPKSLQPQTSPQHKNHINKQVQEQQNNCQINEQLAEIDLENWNLPRTPVSHKNSYDQFFFMRALQAQHQIFLTGSEFY